MKENLFIINGRKIEIGKIVLDRDVLSVSEKSGEYNFYICVSYHWREINELKSHIVKLEKEYSDILERIDDINDFIYEFRHDQNKEDQVKDARAKGTDKGKWKRC